MQNWIDFLMIAFWLLLSLFIFNISNFVNLIIFSESVWIILYTITVYFGALNDDLNLYNLSFFILALAGLEFSIGFLLIIIFKTYNRPINFENKINKFNQSNVNNNLKF